ncbi:hypothetical protein F4Y93_06080 [Candidatus Poribacteria bacterium]|nr:hypothetical protein [Candidatus Poribacteria bacterium]
MDSNSSFQRVAYYVEKVTKNPFLNLGVGLFITVSTIENWDTWYATINNGKIELHHGITVAGVWQVLASLPDVVRSSHEIYLTLKHRGEKKVKITLLHTAEILMEVAKAIITLHRKGVRQEVVDEVHTFVKRIKAIVDAHHQQLEEETSDELLQEDQT